MKLFTKTLLVGAMALAATGAQASIAPSGTNGTAGGELVFNLVNYTANTSYTLDLGVTIGAFLTNVNQAFNFSSILSADSKFASFAASYTAGNNVAWGVAGALSKLTAASDRTNYGFYTTSTVAAPAVFDTTQTEISTTVGKLNSMIGTINTLDAVANNNSTFRDAALAQVTTVPYGNDFQGALNFQGQGALGSSLFFVKEGLLNTVGTTASVAQFGALSATKLTSYGNKWDFAFTGSNATLTYSAAPVVSAVPVPAAVWMFGAGLMGVLRLNRRKTIAA